MPLEPVHVTEIDRATSRLELVRVNPTRSFLINTENGMGLYTWQNGKWFDTGRNEILEPEKNVPQKFLDEIAANPPTGTKALGPAVTWVCKFCGEKMNTSESNEHLISHMNDTLRAAGSKSDRPVTAKNTHAGS